MKRKCLWCDEKFKDEEEYQEHIKSHEDESILSEPDFCPKVRGQRALFTNRMKKIMQQDMPKDWNKIINAPMLFRKKNGKWVQKGGDNKWELLKMKYPQIAKTAWEKYQEKFKDDLGFVTLDNFSDNDTLLDLAEKEEPKKKKKKKAGKTAKILERLDELEKRVAKLEK